MWRTTQSRTIAPDAGRASDLKLGGCSASVWRTKSSCKQPGSSTNQSRLGYGHRRTSGQSQRPGCTALLGFPSGWHALWLVPSERLAVSAENVAGAACQGSRAEPVEPRLDRQLSGHRRCAIRQIDHPIRECTAGRAPFSMQRYGYDCAPPAGPQRVRTVAISAPALPPHSPHEPVEHNICSRFCCDMVVTDVALTPIGADAHLCLP
jgi:hypothetical protein